MLKLINSQVQGNIDLDIDEISSQIKDQLFASLDKVFADNGPKEAQIVLLTVLSKIIADFVFTTLQSSPKGSGWYDNLKKSIEMAIREGFASALNQHTGSDHDFIVKVTEISETISKLAA